MLTNLGYIALFSPCYAIIVSKCLEAVLLSSFSCFALNCVSNCLVLDFFISRDARWIWWVVPHEWDPFLFEAFDKDNLEFGFHHIQSIGNEWIIKANGLLGYRKFSILWNWIWCIEWNNCILGEIFQTHIYILWLFLHRLKGQSWSKAVTISLHESSYRHLSQVSFMIVDDYDGNVI